MTDEPSLEGRVRVVAPQIYAGHFQLMITNSEAVVVCGQPQPYVDSANRADIMAIEHAAVLRMPLVAAKELMLILRNGLAGFEAENGELSSPFIRSQSDK